MLPGTNRASDRFVRASFYIHAIPQTADAKIAVPSVLSVMRNVSVPFGINTPEKPYISSTRWRSVSDQKNKVYYFESTLTPNMFWLDLKKIDFSPKAGIKKLSLTKGEIYAGDAVKGFERQPIIHLPFSRLRSCNLSVSVIYKERWTNACNQTLVHRSFIYRL